MVGHVMRDGRDVKGRSRPKRSGVAAASAREPTKWAGAREAVSGRATGHRIA